MAETRALVKRVRKASATAGRWTRHTLRRWRRARIGRRLLPGRLVLGLTASLIGLFVAFAMCLSFLSASTAGAQLTFDQVENLMHQHRIASAVFEDQDSQVVLRSP